MHQIIKKKLVWIILLILLTLFLFSKIAPTQVNQNTQPSPSVTQPTTTSTHPAVQLVKVTRVVDGDTIEIEGGQKVRYIGIDTPETVDPRKEVQCFGKEASAKNKQLVEGKEVSLEKDVSETDKYGRLLRYVYLGKIFVNDYLVREGYAHASSYPPDVKYQDQFLQAEREAREAKRGLWGNVCSNASSATPTLSSSNLQPPSFGRGTPSNSCLIKGNISNLKEKIYHLPGQKYYDKTVINTGLGEKWFCTEQEAVSFGWRKSKI